MRILFLGPKENATTWQRIEALKENGHVLEVVYDRIIGIKSSFFKRLIRFAFRKMGKPHTCTHNLQAWVWSICACMILYLPRTVTGNCRFILVLRNDSGSVPVA